MKKKPRKKEVPFGYYYCEVEDCLYIKEFGWTPQDGYIDVCWLKSDGAREDFTPFSITFDERYRSGMLEFLGPL